MPEFADRLLPITPHQSGYALGAHWDGRGTQFAVFSERAEKIELCLFDPGGRHQTACLEMPECTDGVWHGYLPGARPGLLYGYRVHGPYRPKEGLRFNPHKLLLDPYARQLAGELRWHDALYAYRIGSLREDLTFDRRDSAAYMPKAVVVDDRYDWGNDHPPRVPWAETVIYEMHLRGFSKRNPVYPEHDRGTFGALGHPHTIEYLKRLGVTAVELLPIHAFARDRRLVDMGLSNYWGYNTLAFFAPDAAYLSDGSLGQVKWAIQQLHAAGIEVILDVVYNHTCEGNELGPTLSWRGFDNAAYYRLLPEDPRRYINDTGCGNTVNTIHPRTIQMVMDSLRWWVQEYHVDGFRFDLGVTLGRETYGFDPGSGFFDALLQDPLLSRVKLISEPWDIGPGGYQVGNHPAGFAEWNANFRDDARRFWRGDAPLRGALAARLQGSADLFDHHRRRPWASVNFITAHDGYTLHDLVSYEHKHNQANGEHNRDGNDSNFSRNWGAEGSTDDPKILAQRALIKRSLLLTLLCSHGTPMLLAGDEFGQTQNGNNNPYCQDNELSWLDWERAASDDGRSLSEFLARLVAIRKEQPLLQGRYFQHARLELAPGLRDVCWFDERGIDMTPEDWNNGAGRLLGLRRAGKREADTLDVLVLLLNADSAAHRFRLPRPLFEYHVLADSKDPARSDGLNEEGYISVSAHSAVLLAARSRIDQVPVIESEPEPSDSADSASPLEPEPA
jgi:glycogen operon protein